MMVWLNTIKQEWVLCLQEPLLTQRGLSKLPLNYTAYWSTRNTSTHKTHRVSNVVIIAPKTMQGYMVSQHSDINCVVVRFDNIQLSVISLYCSVHDNITHSTKLMLEEIAMGRRVIVCADSNAHHNAWGSQDRKRQLTTAYYRGRELMDILDENCLSLCNIPPHPHTFVAEDSRKSSHIDITFASDRIKHRITDWMVHNDTLDSDHRYITFKVSSNREKSGEEMGAATSTTVPWKKPSEKMEKVMNERLQEMVTTRRQMRNKEEIEVYVEKHTAEIQRALTTAFKKRGPHKRRHTYWWNSEVADAYEKMKTARKRKARYKHDALKTEFQKCRIHFRYVIKKSKLESWKAFTTSIQDPWAGLMRIISMKECGRSLSKTLADSQGNYASDLKETLISLSNSFFPPPAPVLQIHEEIEREVERQLGYMSEHQDITKEEFRMALKEMSKSTAPGFDMVTNNVIKYLSTTGGFEDQYIRLFNACLRAKFLPAAWKSAKIILIPKAHTMADSVKALRPISLTSAFAKLLERIVLARILYFLQASNGISANQHAYKKGHSTQTALYQVFSFIHEAIENNDMCIAVFLDISGAFDRTWHIGILHKLLGHGVPTNLVMFVKNFLEGRTAHFKEGSECYDVSLKQGCPQGGVLSPALWNVLFNDLLCLKSDEGNNICVIAYADDAIVLCRAKTVSKASMDITKHLGKIYEWSIKNRVIFNVAKLATMTFAPKFRMPSPSSVYFNNVLVNEVSRYKYLGLHVDNRLKWNVHIESLIGKLEMVVRSLRSVVREDWGVKTGIMRTLYHAIVMPIMTYGIAIWGWRAQTQVIQKKFTKVIRKYCLMSTRCIKTTANIVLFRLMNTDDFSTILSTTVRKVTLLQLRLYNRQLHGSMADVGVGPKSRTMHGFHDICNRCVERRRAIVYDDMNEFYRVHPSQRVGTNCVTKDKTLAVWESVKTTGWCVYTDASAASYGMGWAYVAFHHGFCVSKNYSAMPRCSVFEAEAYAIWQAIGFMKTIRSLQRTEDVEIRTDAQSVVTALECIITPDPMLIRIKEALEEMNRLGVKIKIVWIPGHSNIFGNEFADSVARRAIGSGNVAEVKMHGRDLRREIGEVQKRERTIKWEEYTGRIPKLFMPRLSNIQSFLKSIPSVPLMQVISGHTRLNDFMCRKCALVETPMCRCEEEDETIEHFMFRCPIYDSIREEIWPNFQPTFSFITQDWAKLNRYVMASKRFSNPCLQGKITASNVSMINENVSMMNEDECTNETD